MQKVIFAYLLFLQAFIIFFIGLMENNFNTLISIWLTGQQKTSGVVWWLAAWKKKHFNKIAILSIERTCLITLYSVISALCSVNYQATRVSGCTTWAPWTRCLVWLDITEFLSFIWHACAGILVYRGFYLACLRRYTGVPRLLFGMPAQVYWCTEAFGPSASTSWNCFTPGCRWACIIYIKFSPIFYENCVPLTYKFRSLGWCVSWLVFNAFHVVPAMIFQLMKVRYTHWT